MEPRQKHRALVKKIGSRVFGLAGITSPEEAEEIEANRTDKGDVI